MDQITSASKKMRYDTTTINYGNDQDIQDDVNEIEETSVAATQLNIRSSRIKPRDDNSTQRPPFQTSNEGKYEDTI